jgi:putative membrane protein
MNIPLTLAVTLADSWGMHGSDVGWGWMVVMAGVMILFWGAVIFGIIWLARGGTGGWGRREPRSEAPSEILERRFVEGAISAEEYHERREVIAHGG